MLKKVIIQGKPYIVILQITTITKFSYYTINIFMLQALISVSVMDTCRCCSLQAKTNIKLRKAEKKVAAHK